MRWCLLSLLSILFDVFLLHIELWPGHLVLCVCCLHRCAHRKIIMLDNAILQLIHWQSQSGGVRPCLCPCPCHRICPEHKMLVARNTLVLLFWCERPKSICFAHKEIWEKFYVRHLLVSADAAEFVLRVDRCHFNVSLVANVGRIVFIQKQ